VEVAEIALVVKSVGLEVEVVVLSEQELQAKGMQVDQRLLVMKVEVEAVVQRKLADKAELLELVMVVLV
jgi:hypothetical protein